MSYDAHPQYYMLSKMFSKEKGTSIYPKVSEDLNASDKSGLKEYIAKAYKDGYFKNEYSMAFVERIISSLFYSYDEIFFRGDGFELEKAISFLQEFINF